MSLEERLAKLEAGVPRPVAFLETPEWATALSSLRHLAKGAPGATETLETVVQGLLDREPLSVRGEEVVNTVVKALWQYREILYAVLRLTGPLTPEYQGPRPSVEEFMKALRNLDEYVYGEPAPDIPTPEPDSNGKLILHRSLYGRDEAGNRTIKGYSRDGDGSWVRD